MQHLEDLALGRWFDCGCVRLEREEIIAFARRYDPQPFHTKPEVAAQSLFGGLVASSLHTLSACIGQMVRAIAEVSVVCGLGLDPVALPRPVRPGETLRVRACWVSARPSRSRPGEGIARIVGNATAGESEVIRFGVTYLVRRRPNQGDRP